MNAITYGYHNSPILRSTEKVVLQKVKVSTSSNISKTPSVSIIGTTDKLDFNSNDFIDVEIRLKKNLSLYFKKTDGFFQVENRDFEIYCMSDRLTELKEQIIDVLHLNWLEYVEEKVENLTSGAKELRNVMLEYFERV